MKLAFANRPIPRRVLAATLALVAAAGMVAGRERSSAELAPQRAPAAPASAGTDIDLTKLEPRQASAPRTDPFAARSFAPPRVQQASAPAPAPSAPPLPFAYFGRLTENGKTEVFVMRGDELIAVAAGRRIDNEYRVDTISESSISFTYLPLKMQQSLELAGAGG